MSDTMKSWVKRQFRNFFDEVLDPKLSSISFDGADENFIIPSECKTNWKPETHSNSEYSSGNVTNGYYTSNLVTKTGDGTYKLNLREIPFYFRVFSYNDDDNYKGGGDGGVTLDADGYVTFTFTQSWSKFCIVMSGNNLDWNNIVLSTAANFGGKRVIIQDLVLSDKTKEELDAVPNLLKGKKWAVCGDSFSLGTGMTETIRKGKYAGEKAVYEYLIANRNDMNIQSLFVGGRTLAEPEDGSFTNCLTRNYQNIAADVDYITIYLGINDSHHRPDATGSDGEDTTGVIPLGTISDNTKYTFYGAWNVILPWLIANRPNAKIGILVSNGCETDDYRLATIECAKKWGIPYIDLNGDERTPMMLRSTNPTISDTAKNSRFNAWKVSAENGHPNAAAHAYESTFIENFLRSL